MKRIFTRLVFFTVLGLLSACNKPPHEKTPTSVEPVTGSAVSKVYVLCEGLFAMNNTSLFVWDLKSGEWRKNYFKEVNGRGMGDTGNDLEIYGGKMYAVMNGSNLIEVMDAATARSLRQIPMTNERGVGRQPRCLCCEAGKIYVACFDNTVCRIDTTTLEVEAVAAVGRNPDGICASGGKLYVSNSGGLDYPNFDSTVSVVDIAGFTEIRKIAVGKNPYTVCASSRGYVYVSTRGDYSNYNLYRIDTRTDTVDRVFNIPVLNFCIAGDSAYLYNYNYDTKTREVMVMDLVSEKIVCADFVGNAVDLNTPYAIAATSADNMVLIGDAFNFQVNGNLYVFSKQGELLNTFSAIGLNPSACAFLRE